MALVNAAGMRSIAAAARHPNQRLLYRSVFLNQRNISLFNIQRALTPKAFIHSHSKKSASVLNTVPPISPRGRDDDRPLRILSLDGGGVRGLSSLIILREFLARMGEKTGAAKPILPADFFDLIVGTSTGGIIALMLGRLRMDVHQAIGVYKDLSKKVFCTGWFPPLLSYHTLLYGKVPIIYDASKLEQVLKETIAKHTKDGDAEALLEDLSPNSCRTAIITARSADASRPVRMRSYLVPHDAEPENFKIWEAARATSAAPTYFRPIEAGDDKVPYIDGGVSGHSNPSWLAMQEAKYLWPKRQIGLFMSLGTGSPSMIEFRSKWALSMFRDFINLGTSTGQIHEMAWQKFNDDYQISPYVRLSVDHLISKVSLSDLSSLDKIVAATHAYLEVARTSDKVQRCVQLVNGPSKLQAKLKPLTRVDEDEDDTRPSLSNVVPSVASKGPSTDHESGRKCLD
ncbi:Calcium-independent phospholipase A2-gamma [Rhizoctonia solani]|uniref:Calcium-independent phospholipase A2-gamma n=1 Tax=Rhizoctonia solani TaxID=456999 RepID=A0A0K6FMT1_9AGAM|nr:Calcium-independent phospholipase A2-gamma [Rhizoctonia solani]